MCVAATTAQVDDPLTIEDKNPMKPPQQEDEEKLRLGSPENSSLGFLGPNYSKSKNGELVVYNKHYGNSPETSHLSQPNHKTEQDVLDQPLRVQYPRSMSTTIRLRI